MCLIKSTRFGFRGFFPGNNATNNEANNEKCDPKFNYRSVRQSYTKSNKIKSKQTLERRLRARSGAPAECDSSKNRAPNKRKEGRQVPNKPNQSRRRFLLSHSVWIVCYSLPLRGKVCMYVISCSDLVFVQLIVMKTIKKSSLLRTTAGLRQTDPKPKRDFWYLFAKPQQRPQRFL